MANIILDKIQIKRGLKANLPILDDGEPALCTDTGELAFGTSSGNIFISAGAGAGTLVFDTLADLQAAYPGGTTQPAWVIGDNAWYYWSGTVTPPADTTAPTLTITAGGTFTGTKTVTMSANETATIYYTLDGSTPTTSSVIYSTPLSVSATTTLKAFAKDTAGNSSAIQTVVYTLDTAPADTTPPSNVTNLAYSNLAQTSLTLTWTASASSDVASYDVYNGATLLANVTGVTYNVSGLTASTQYTFTVKAKDAANNVANGTSVTMTTSAPADTTPPATPTGLATSAITTSGATLNWSSNVDSDLAGYNVYVDNVKKNGSLLVTTSYNLTGLAAGTTYSVQVTAVDTSNNESTKSAAVSLTTSAPIVDVNDTFNRADSTSLGTATSGHVWAPVTGLSGSAVWGIANNQASVSGSAANENIAVLDSGRTDGTVEVVFAAIQTTGQQRLVFRFKDGTNHWLIQANGNSSYAMYKNINNSYTLIGTTSGVTPTAGDKVTVVLSGTSVKGYINAVEKFSTTDSALQTYTKVGLGTANNAAAQARWDDFKVTSSIVAP